jgi:hypothetical protein
VVKVQNKISVSRFPLPLFLQMILPVRRKFSHLPRLPLVFPKILDREGLDVWNSEESLARRLDRKSAQVARNPTTIKLFGRHGRGASTTKEVADEISFIRRRFENTLKKCFWLLRGITDSLDRL